VIDAFLVSHTSHTNTLNRNRLAPGLLFLPVAHQLRLRVGARHPHGVSQSRSTAPIAVGSIHPLRVWYFLTSAAILSAIQDHGRSDYALQTSTKHKSKQTEVRGRHSKSHSTQYTGLATNEHTELHWGDGGLFPENTWRHSKHFTQKKHANVTSGLHADILRLTPSLSFF
jgi:hypothetical protein